jgi:hypothetical protein
MGEREEKNLRWKKKRKKKMGRIECQVIRRCLQRRI